MEMSLVESSKYRNPKKWAEYSGGSLLLTYCKEMSLVESSENSNSKKWAEYSGGSLLLQGAEPSWFIEA